MKIKAYLTLVFIIVSWIIIHAQDITGNIEGYIVDSTISDLNGYFKFLALTVGFYKIKISHIG